MNTFLKNCFKWHLIKLRFIQVYSAFRNLGWCTQVLFTQSFVFSLILKNISYFLPKTLRFLTNAFFNILLYFLICQNLFLKFLRNWFLDSKVIQKSRNSARFLFLLRLFFTFFLMLNCFKSISIISNRTVAFCFTYISKFYQFLLKFSFCKHFLFDKKIFKMKCR